MTTAVAWQNATGLVTVIVGRYMLTHWDNADAAFRVMTFDTVEEAHRHAVRTVALGESKGNTIPFGPVPFDVPDVIVHQIDHHYDLYVYEQFRSWPLLHRVAAALAATPKWRPHGPSMARIQAAKIKI